MRTAIELRMVRRMAVETNLIPGNGRFPAKSEHIAAPAARSDVLADIAVAVEAKERRA
jgi:hypothetical protein